MIAQGFLGTRADWIMDFTLTGVVVSPLLMAYSFRKARAFKLEGHRLIQTLLFFVLFAAVILFETDVRISSRKSSFIEPSPWVDNPFFKGFLLIHISIALATFAGWLTLGIVSYRSFQKTLPGSFSVKHKRYGKWIFSGIIFTALSGSLIYVIAFVL